MVTRIIVIITLIVLQSNQSKAQVISSKRPDHSFMFDRATDWLSKASASEIKEVIFHPGFIRFSVTRNDSIVVLYDSNCDSGIVDSTSTENNSVVVLNNCTQRFEKNDATIEAIYSAVKWFFSKYPVNSMAKKPDVDFWDLKYFERDEIYQKGPVFVFRDNQLTHVWLDIPKQ